MRQADRRQFRRTSLRLRISQLGGLGQDCDQSELWTSDISAGGMYFHVPLPAALARGTYLTFELTVPPGEGYSSSAGKVRGSGQVVRSALASGLGTGVAVQFTKPLALDF